VRGEGQKEKRKEKNSCKLGLIFLGVSEKKKIQEMATGRVIGGQKKKTEGERRKEYRGKEFMD